MIFFAEPGSRDAMGSSAQRIRSGLLDEGTGDANALLLAVPDSWSQRLWIWSSDRTRSRMSNAFSFSSAEYNPRTACHRGLVPQEAVQDVIYHGLPRHEVEVLEDRPDAGPQVAEVPLP